MKRHIGSTIALAIGILSLISYLTKPNDMYLVAPITILGALAYRSAKKRTLNEVDNSLLRKCIEVAAIIIIIALVLLQNDLSNRVYTHPVPNLIIPLWAIIAYLIIVMKRKKDSKQVGELISEREDR